MREWQGVRGDVDDMIFVDDWFVSDGKWRKSSARFREGQRPERFSFYRALSMVAPPATTSPR